MGDGIVRRVGIVVDKHYNRKKKVYLKQIIAEMKKRAFFPIVVTQHDSRNFDDANIIVIPAQDSFYDVESKVSQCVKRTMDDDDQLMYFFTRGLTYYEGPEIEPMKRTFFRKLDGLFPEIITSFRKDLSQLIVRGSVRPNSMISVLKRCFRKSPAIARLIIRKNSSVVAGPIGREKASTTARPVNRIKCSTDTRPIISKKFGVEIGLAATYYGMRLNSPQSFSGGVFARYGFRPGRVVNPFLQLEGNGGGIGDESRLNYGGIKAGGGVRLTWGSMDWLYSTLAFTAGPAFSNKGVLTQLGGELMFGVKISMTAKSSLLIDFLSLGYNAFIKNNRDIKHALSLQTKIAVQF